MLQMHWGWMHEALKGMFNVTGHGDVAGSIRVIPVESQSAVMVTIPFSTGAIKFLQGGEKLFSIIPFHVFDTKVTDDQTKDKAAVLVEPQSRRVGKGFIAMRGKEVLKSVSWPAEGHTYLCKPWCTQHPYGPDHQVCIVS